MVLLVLERAVSNRSLCRCGCRTHILRGAWRIRETTPNHFSERNNHYYHLNHWVKKHMMFLTDLMREIASGHMEL